MQKNSITNKITPCCGLPFSVVYWWVSNLTLNSESDRQYLLTQISQNGVLSIDGWKVLINSGTLEADASLTKAEFLAWFDCGRQPNCEQLKLIVEGYKIGNWTPETELPLNLATVDKIVNGLTYVGNTYDKAQTDYKIQEAKSQAYLGIATTTTTPPATGACWYRVNAPGIYMGVTVTEADFKDAQGNYFDVTIEVKDGVATKKKDAKVVSTSTAKIETWSAKSYTQGSQVIYEEKIYEANASTLAGDVPGVAPVWVQKVGGVDLTDVIDVNNTEKAVSGKAVTDYVLATIEPGEKVLKHFIENKTFVDQDEVGILDPDDNSFKIFTLDNTQRDITSIYTKGNMTYNGCFIRGIKENNSNVCLIGSSDTTIIDHTYNLDLRTYKSIVVGFYVGGTFDKNPIVKTTRQSLNPPIEDAVKKYTDTEILPIRQAIEAFKNGSDIFSVGKLAINRGFKRPDLSAFDSDYGFWSEIPYKKGYNKIHYQAKFATEYYGTSMAIMAVLKNGSKVAIKQGFPGEVINGVFDIPENTVQIFVNFASPQFIADPFPKNVYLFKQGLSEDSILNYLTNIYKVETPQNKSFLRIHRPKSFFRMDLDGVLPTDATDTRIPTNMVMTIYDDHNEKYFKCDVEVKIQGNITAGEAKGSYSVKFKNDIGGKLKVKMGDWLPFSGFHLKGYPIDWSYTRTVSGGKLLKQFFDDRPFPQSKQGTFYPSNPNPLNTNNYLNEAKFYVDGVPTKVFLNGTFLGISVMQQKRDADIFHINEDDINQIFITNNNGFDLMDMYNGFKDNMWEVRSPKMDGYKEGLPVPDATVQAKLDRFFNWYKDVYAGTQNFNTTKQDYINVDNWVDVFVHSQVIGNVDFGGNNLNFAILNGLTYQFVTDMDITAGANGMVYNVEAMNCYGYSKLLPQIKARYADLRNKKIISLNNLYNIYNEIPAMIGGEEYIQNYTKWNGLITTPSVHSIPYIMNWFKERLIWLDAYFEYVPS